ncbi:MAG: hypothetical protein AAB390_04345 [Patescibacteria group bacterium]
MELDLTKSDRELALAIIATSPEGDDTYDKGEIRDLLYNPDKADRARYAAIFGMAAELSASIERRATFRLEQVNGLRRQPGLWDIKAVTRLLEQTQDMILGLPDGTRRDRLNELECYHAGLVYREAGDYEKAIEAQVKSASFAHDMARRAISHFCATVEYCHHGLVTGDSTIMADALCHLMMSSERLEGFHDNPDLTVRQWLEANGPAHRLYAHDLTGRSYAGHLADLHQMCNLSVEHRDTYSSWTAALQALEFWRLSDYAKATLYATKCLEHGTFLIVPYLIAQLVLARVAVRMNQPEIGVGIYLALIYTPSHGGDFVRALAKREAEPLQIL